MATSVGKLLQAFFLLRDL